MRAWLILSFALALTARPASVQAQTGEDATPALVPPKQLPPPPVPYPAGAKGDAVVTVQVVVGASGEVESVTVLDGEDPFAAAARTAAEGWRFEPATRDGVAVRATIKATVTFAEPPPPTPAPLPTPPPPPKPKTKKTHPKVSDAPVDITVEGERKEIAQTSVSGGEVRILPGAFGDPFRMVEALPGVVPVFSGLPFFYVRGAPPGNIGYFIDGVRVPMLFHLGAGPSVLAPGIIDRVDFHPSAYPTRFGRNAGAIIAGETRGPATRTRGEWNVRLFDASAMVETPFRDKQGRQRGDVMVAGRYGYPGLLLSLLSSEVGLQYWDYQLRAGYNVNDRDRVSTFFFGAFDRLVDKEENVTLFDVQFHRADVRWDRTLPDGRMRVASTLMFDQTGIGDSGSNRDERFGVRMLGTGLRGELEKRLAPGILFRSGADVWLERYSLLSRGGGGDEARLFPTRTDVFAGTRFDFVLRPTPAVEIVPGVRFDVYTQGAIMVPAVEPRLAARLKVARRVWAISTMGLAHQTASFVIPGPALRIGSLARGLQEAWQFAQGVEVELPQAKTRATMTAFYTGFRNMSDVIAVCGPGKDEDDCELDARINGRAYGLELMLKRDLTEKIGGWLAYTLSRSTRSAPGRVQTSDFDRTHVVSAVFSWDMGKGYRFGSRFSFQTGRPWTGVVTRSGTTGDDDPRTNDRRILRQRLPEFWRLDVRFEKRWIYSDTTSLAFVVEWFNMLLKKEPIEYRRCRYDGSNCLLEELGPVTIPSLGLEGTF